MLHQAAASAATRDAADMPERMVVLRFLFEEERLDVNRIDTYGQLPNILEAPIAYALEAKGGDSARRCFGMCSRAARTLT